ncbi:hypothetical protein LCGC14_2905690, partial [marine sediment metagenome]
REMVKALEDGEEWEGMDVEEAIAEDPLEVAIRADWHSPGDDADVDLEFKILLCTGGPAVRIIGGLGQWKQPDSVKIEYQDWSAGKIETYPTDANAIENLALGDGVRIDALITAKPTLFEAINAGCGGNCPLKMLGDPVFYEHLSFALDRSRPNSESLLKKLNEILSSMYKDGTLVDLSMQFYGQNLIPKL